MITYEKLKNYGKNIMQRGKDIKHWLVRNSIMILTILAILFIAIYQLQRSSQSVVVVDIPTTVETGSPFTISWKVNSNSEYQINHTAIHYGPDSESEPLTLISYPNVTYDYSGVMIPATFSANITINTPGVTYFRAYATINDVNYWSEEKRIVVNGPPISTAPTIDISDAPSEADVGSPFTITWKVNSNVEYQTIHTAVHYGPESESEPLGLTSYQNITDVHRGLVPATFSSNITIDTPGIIYLRAHIIIDNVNYWSEEKRIVITEPRASSVPTIDITDAPSRAEAGSPFTVTWKVNSNVEYQTSHTAVHYGPYSESEPLTLTSYSNISNVYGGLIPAIFSSDIIVNTPGVIYFRAHIIINDVNYWSKEKSIIISEQPSPATPSIQITSYPISVRGDSNFTIRWKVYGGKPGQIRYTLIHWGLNRGGPNGGDYDKISNVQGGNTPAEFRVELKATARGPIYFRIHTMVDDTDLYSQEYKITII